MIQRRALRAALGCACLLLASAAGARGVSPYLPLHQSPDIERKIERLMILAGRPVMTRPVPAAAVLDALPDACERDEALCAEVRRYLSGYMRTSGIGHLEVDVAAARDEAAPLPNRHGMASDSGYEVTGSVYWQPSDRWIVTFGIQAYDGETTPTGTMLSVGSQYAQLDVGFRDHWFSPFTDASMLIGTQAPTMPSLTVSSYEPISRFGFRYEVFFAQMSESQSIRTLTGTTTGEPVLSGVHLSIEPFPGWSVGINRIMQFGGGDRDASLRDWFNAFFNPSKNDNTGTPADFGNQAGSFTTRFVWPGAIPGAVYFEYAGEDTSNSNSLRLGNSALSAGVFLPQLGGRFDLTVEASECQNGWYEHHIYLDGLRNEGHVIGHWGGDARLVGDAVGGRSFMASVGWEPRFSGLLVVTARSLKNESYSQAGYKRASGLEIEYSRAWGQFRIGTRLDAGRDVFGKSFSRVAVMLRF